MKKKLVFSAMLVCLLALGLALTGCSSDDGGGGVSLPGNLRNTTWKDGDDTLEFKVNEIVLNGNTGERTFTVVSAAENGRIVAGEKHFGDYYEEEEFCGSYSISADGTTLTLTGDRSFSGQWTRQAGNGTSTNLANTTRRDIYNDSSDGTVITATLSFSGANAYTLGVKIDIVEINMSFTPSQTGTYTLTDNKITLTPAQGSTGGIFTETGTLSGNTISMLIGIDMYNQHEEGVFTLTKM
jgi:hypothetical protein